MFQSKRPASTAGLPAAFGPVIVTPGVATIRRTPSTKPSVRRGTIGGGPIPIKTPVIPVKTPTVPGALPHSTSEESSETSPDSPLITEAPLLGGEIPTSLWSGQASINPPAPGSQGIILEEQRSGRPDNEDEEDELDGPGIPEPTALPEPGMVDGTPSEAPQGEDMLNAIRRGVKLKKTTTNDRSAPRLS